MCGGCLCFVIGEPLFLVLACVVLVFLCRAGLCGFGKLELVLIKVSCGHVSPAIPFFSIACFAVKGRWDLNPG